MKIIISERQQKLIKENSVRDSLIKQIREEGWEDTADMVGGSRNLGRLVGLTKPSKLLNIFNDLKSIPNKDNDYLVNYVNDSGKAIMIYDRKNKYVYVNQDFIWSALMDYFDFSYYLTQVVIKEWLYDVYNLDVVSGTNYPFYYYKYL